MYKNIYIHIYKWLYVCSMYIKPYGPKYLLLGSVCVWCRGLAVSSQTVFGSIGNDYKWRFPKIRWYLQIIYVIDDHDWVLKPMVTWGSTIYDIISYLYIYIHIFYYKKISGHCVIFFGNKAYHSPVGPSFPKFRQVSASFGGKEGEKMGTGFLQNHWITMIAIFRFPLPFGYD